MNAAQQWEKTPLLHLCQPTSLKTSKQLLGLWRIMTLKTGRVEAHAAGEGKEVQYCNVVNP